MSVGDVNSTARGSGARFNDGKVPLELLPLRAYAESLWRADFTPSQLAAHIALHALATWQESGRVGSLHDAARAVGSPWHSCARVFEYGRGKYAAWNWAKGMAWSIPLACAARHLEKIIVHGEADDPESGLPHIGHFLCNVAMLITFQRTFPEGDDRPRTLAPAQPVAPRLFAAVAEPGPVVHLEPLHVPVLEEGHDG